MALQVQNAKSGLELQLELIEDLESVLQCEGAAGTLQFSHHSVEPIGEQGILSALAGSFGSPRLGLWRHALQCTVNGCTEEQVFVVKRKPGDATLLPITSRVAGSIEPVLANHALLLLKALNLAGAPERESYVLSLSNPGLSRFKPKLFAARYQPEIDEWMMAIEHIEHRELCDEETLLAAIGGLGALHALSYGNPGRTVDALSVPSVVEAEYEVQLASLWHLVAEMIRPLLSELWGEDAWPIQNGLLHSVASWIPSRSELPQALIHNDFNPRNITFRLAEEGSLQMCAYDWELAAVGMPEQDLAELLCFVLPPNAVRSDVESLRRLHRNGIEAACGRRVKESVSIEAFRRSLKFLFVNRLSLSALCLLLPRQVLSGSSPSISKGLKSSLENWKRLYEWYC